MGIPDAAVEAAARNMFDLRVIELDQSPTEWDELPEPWQDEWRDGARAAIEAAAPHILRDAADEVRGYAYTPDDVREVAHGDDYADGITDAHHVFDRLLAARAARIADGVTP
ncbi:MAG: hypothetical protein EOL90_09380 [Spartobacteria bacterium]|nr:hypothetical protein [Spartobacteria bacterium]